MTYGMDWSAVFQKEYASLIGKTITSVRAMSGAEARAVGWGGGSINGPACVLVLDDGQTVYPSRDPEGNGPGFLFVDGNTTEKAVA